jgi:tricorn protease
MKRLIVIGFTGVLLAIGDPLARAAQQPDQAPAAATPRWVRYPAISPDGTFIAFALGGQLWLVPAQGGEATPLTSSEFYATRPVWSPDGRRIAFACQRNGNFDVFVMGLDGATPQRLTFHSANDLPYAFSPDGQSIFFSSSRLGSPETELVGAYHDSAQLYTVPATGGPTRLLLPTPAHDVAVSPDGRTLVYDNCPVYENEWRKGAVSDGARDLWLFDFAAGKHRQLTRNRGEDRDGCFAPDGRSLYYLSEQAGGSFNVWQVGLEADAQPRPITRHTGRPVRFLSMARDGTLVYAYDGSLWRRDAKGGEARRLDLTIRQAPLVSGSFAARANPYVSEIAARPNGSEVAVVARGEIYAVATGSGRARRITSTPAFEQHVSFSPDGRRLLYCSEREGASEIYEVALPEGRSAFTAPGGLEEKRIVASEVDLLFPAYSPDGQRIAFYEDRNRIKVWDRERDTTATALPPGYIYSYIDGDLSFDWSPDGRYLLATVGSIAGDLDIALCDATGRKAPVNLSQSGYANMNPTFLPDGQSVLWVSDRLGLRSADGSGGQMDLFIAHLTQEAYDAFRLARSGTPASPPMPSKSSMKDAAPWEPQTEGIRHRITRLTPSSLSGVLFAKGLPGGRDLLLVGVNDAQQMVGYRVGLTSESFAQVFAQPISVVAASLAPSGEALYGVGPAGIERIALTDGRSSLIPLAAQLDYDPRGEMDWLFQHCWLLTKRKFYQPTLHGRDWDALRADYSRYLPGLQQWEDFCDLMGEMAGELNASHMGCSWHHQPALADDTAALGLYLDHAYPGPGVKVKEILVGGPCDLSRKPIAPGDLLTELDGVPVRHSEHLSTLLNRKAGQPVELAVAARPGATPRPRGRHPHQRGGRKGPGGGTLDGATPGHDREVVGRPAGLPLPCGHGSGELPARRGLHLRRRPGQGWAGDRYPLQRRRQPARPAGHAVHRRGHGRFPCAGRLPRQPHSEGSLGQAQHPAGQWLQLLGRQHLPAPLPAAEDRPHRGRPRPRHRHRRVVDGVAQRRHQVRHPAAGRPGPGDRLV